MPKTETKRKIGKKDIDIYCKDMAKPGGKLDKAGTSLRVSKSVSPPGSPLTPAKPKQEAKEGRGLIYRLVNKSKIEENKKK